MIRNTVVIIITILLSGIFSSIHSQNIDISSESIGVISSNSTTPFWLHSNRNGVVARDGSHFLSRFQAHGSDDLFGPVTIHYGADLIARPGSSSTLHFNQGYVKFRAYGMELAAGRFMHISPEYNERLGMGSLGVSGNTTPVPQIRVGFYDWVPLPLTNGLFEIKAHVAHGWLGSNRFVDNVLYHEKVGFGRIGGDFPLNIYGGIHHFAKWGGESPVAEHGKLPSTFADFWRVFIVVGGDEEAPVIEQDYMLGDHLGAWDFGFYLDLNDVNLKVYRQFPLETKDNLKFKSLQDALTGLHFTFSDQFALPVKEFIYEHLYTKWQDGPRRENFTDDGIPCSDPSVECRDPFRGNENYYNHGIYRSGWTYQGSTIGNPLFIPGLPNVGIINNRIVAHHIGILSQHGRISLTTRATYSRNYGTWNDPFEERASQWSFAAGIETPVTISNFPATMLLETAYDNGDLVGNQFGILFGLRVSP